jgi:hypothetical protein
MAAVHKNLHAILIAYNFGLVGDNVWAICVLILECLQ